MFRVLLVDDEPIVTRGLKEKIPWAELGCVVVGTAMDGQEALEKVEQETPHLVLCDIRMPRLSGLEFISAMKDLDPDCQIIILTGYRNFDYAKKAIDLGVLQYLLKPSKIPEITQAISQAVEGIRQREERQAQWARMLEQLRHQENPQIPSEEKGREEIHPLVKEARDYLRRNFQMDHDLNSVSQALGVSSWHLSKTVKKELDISFVDLLNGIRMEEAENLLRFSTMKVYEIAEKVGFHDVAYFSRVFKRFSKMTPNQFRKKHYQSF